MKLTADAIKNGIGVADWWTLGEIHGLEEDDVDAFMDQLKWSDDPIEIKVEPNQRPIQLHAWFDPERVRTEIEELSEREDLFIPSRVHDHLANVRGIVALELGWTQLRTMYETVAIEIAYWLAEIGTGVILSPDDYWFDHDNNRWDPIKDPG